MQVGVVISFDDAKPARLDDQQMVDHAVEKISVVADQQHRAVELGQGRAERIAGPQVQMVRRFVEDQKIRIIGRQLRQGRAAALAAAQAIDCAEIRRLPPARTAPASRVVAAR